MKKLVLMIVLLIAIIACTANLPQEPGFPGSSTPVGDVIDVYVDVPDGNNWASPAVDVFTGKKILSLTEENDFTPDADTHDLALAVQIDTAFIYRTAAYLDVKANKWRPLRLDGPDKQGKWFWEKAELSFSVPIEQLSLTDTNFLIVYGCKLERGQYNCGCREESLVYGGPPTPQEAEVAPTEQAPLPTGNAVASVSQTSTGKSDPSEAKTAEPPQPNQIEDNVVIEQPTSLICSDPSIGDFKWFLLPYDVRKLPIEPELPVHGQCTDSDSGKNYYVQGTAFDKADYSVGGKDSCFEHFEYDHPVLNEYYCETNEVKSIIYDCPNGCKDGACTEKESENCWAVNGKCDSACEFSDNVELQHYTPECSKTCREDATYFQLSGTCSDGDGKCYKRTGFTISSTSICTDQLQYPYGDSSCSGDGGDWCVDGTDYSKGTNCKIYEEVSTDATQCQWLNPKEVLRQKLFVLIYDPVIESEGKKLHEVYGWEDPISLNKKMIDDLQESSHGLLNLEVVELKVVDDYPPYKNGCSYTDESYRQGLEKFYASGSEESFCKNTEIDMGEIDRVYEISDKVEVGEVDELFLWGTPGAGYPWESAMAGDGAYWINGPPELGITSSKPFVIMGLNYERGVAEALESFGHRSDWILQKVFNGGGWSGYVRHEGNAWDRYLIKDIDVKGKGGIGDIHDAVNAREGHGYDRSSRDIVLSNADEWLNYPDIDYDNRREIWCNEWGCDVEGNDDAREYEKWWYAHLPHAPGKTDGKYNNWWKYIVNLEESVDSPVPVCTDSDGGIDKFTKGLTKGRAFSGSYFENEDSCGAGPTPGRYDKIGVYEHYCSKKVRLFACEDDITNCYDGSCEASQCEDSSCQVYQCDDEGWAYQLEEAGATGEYYSIGPNWFECKAGCEDGACLVEGPGAPAGPGTGSSGDSGDDDTSNGDSGDDGTITPPPFG